MYYRGITDVAFPYDTYEHESWVLAESTAEAKEKITRWCKFRYKHPPTSCIMMKFYWDRTGYGIYG